MVTVEQSYSAEAERRVLSVLMSDEAEIPALMSVLTEDAFYDHKNRAVYHAIVELDKAQMPVELTSVVEELRKEGKDSQAGGLNYILELSTVNADFTSAMYYARVIVQKYMERQFVMRMQQLVGKVGSTDIADLLADADQLTEEVRNIATLNASVKPVKVYAEEALEAAKKREERFKSGKVTGITTGISSLDRMITGLQNGSLYILAGRPASGKTSVMLKMAKSAAESGAPVAIFSLEMTGVQLADRLLLSYGTGVSYDYRRGNLTEKVMTVMSNGITALSVMPMYIVDRAAVSIHYIRNEARRLRKEVGLKVLFIDYLQLIGTTSGGREQTRDREVAQITASAKRLAKELDIPVVMLSQLNRSCESRADKRPELQDLRESGAIEQDADVVMFVYRPEVYGLTNESGQSIKGEGKIIVAKQRDGGIGDAKFGYDKSITNVWGIEEESAKNIFNKKLPF